MIKVNLNKSFVDHTGKELEDKESLNMAKLLALRMFHHTSGDPLKFFNWSQELYKEGELSIDEADHKTLVTFVKDLPQLSLGLKAQLLKEIDG